MPRHSIVLESYHGNFLFGKTAPGGTLMRAMITMMMMQEACSSARVYCDVFAVKGLQSTGCG